MVKAHRLEPLLEILDELVETVEHGQAQKPKGYNEADQDDRHGKGRASEALARFGQLEPPRRSIR